MTREIKFRAWDRGNNLWLTSPHWKYYLSWEGDRLLVGGNHIVEVTQYTGLKDKNGKEIYEGDKIKRGELGVSVVGFEEGAFVLLEGENEPLSHYDHEDWKIIGNIYEGGV